MGEQLVYLSLGQAMFLEYPVKTRLKPGLSAVTRQNGGELWNLL